MTDALKPKKTRKSVPRPYAAKNKKPLPPGIEGAAIWITSDAQTMAAFKKAKPNKRGPTPKLQQQLERISQLPKARQRVVSEVLDSLLAQGGR